jgi:hypothetical protein
MLQILASREIDDAEKSVLTAKVKSRRRAGMKRENFMSRQLFALAIACPEYEFGGHSSDARGSVGGFWVNLLLRVFG